MAEPTRPGQKCRIIGSWSKDNGLGDGPNMHKEVVTLYLHELRAADVVPVWQVKGDGLTTNYGGKGDEVACLQPWLEVLPDEPPKAETTAKHLELTQ